MNTLLPPACPDTIPLIDLWYLAGDGRRLIGCLPTGPVELDLLSRSFDKGRADTSIGPVRLGDNLAEARRFCARQAAAALRGELP